MGSAGSVGLGRSGASWREMFGGGGRCWRFGPDSARSAGFPGWAWHLAGQKGGGLWRDFFQRPAENIFSGWRGRSRCSICFVWLALAVGAGFPLVRLGWGWACAGACSRSTTGQARKLCVLCGVLRRLIAARGFYRSTFSFSEKRSKNRLLSLGRVVYL